VFPNAHDSPAPPDVPGPAGRPPHLVRLGWSQALTSTEALPRCAVDDQNKRWRMLSGVAFRRREMTPTMSGSPSPKRDAIRLARAGTRDGSRQIIAGQARQSATKNSAFGALSFHTPTFYPSRQNHRPLTALAATHHDAVDTVRPRVAQNLFYAHIYEIVLNIRRQPPRTVSPPYPCPHRVMSIQAGVP
jgi:hypothetical protein